MRNIIYRTGAVRANHITSQIRPFLDTGGSILHIGSGSCNVCETLSDQGHSVTPLDIQGVSCVGHIGPIIYDGRRIPFGDDSFDTALILTVLHHTQEPKQILKEAGRVSRRIIVMEDVYTNSVHKYMTYAWDSVLNLEFFGHPHSNKNDEQWRETFRELDLKLVDVQYDRALFSGCTLATYYLET